VYPVVFVDCVNVKISDGQVANRPIYVALAVTSDGHRDILGLRAGEHGDGEGASYWPRVLSELKNRECAETAALPPTYRSTVSRSSASGATACGLVSPLSPYPHWS